MPFIPLRGMGKLGVIKDSQNQAMPIGSWQDARNMRFSGVSFEKMLEPTLEMPWGTVQSGDGYACDAFAADMAANGWEVIDFADIQTEGVALPSFFGTYGGGTSQISPQQDKIGDPLNTGEPLLQYSLWDVTGTYDACRPYALSLGENQVALPQGAKLFFGGKQSGVAMAVSGTFNNTNNGDTVFWRRLNYTVNWTGSGGGSMATTKNADVKYQVGQGFFAYNGSTSTLIANPTLDPAKNLIYIRTEIRNMRVEQVVGFSPPRYWVVGDFVVTLIVNGVQYDYSSVGQQMSQAYEGTVTFTNVFFENTAMFFGFETDIFSLGAFDGDVDAGELYTWYQRNDIDYVPPTSAGGTPLWLQGWNDGLSSYFALAANDGASDYLYFWQASSANSGKWIQAGGPYAQGQWQSFEWGDTCVFNNGTGAPQIFNPSTLRFEDLPKWGLISNADDINDPESGPSVDTAARCVWILPFKNVLVAGAVTESGRFGANTVWWSGATTLPGYGSGPLGTDGPPDWDYENPASLSGKSEVGIGAGPIKWGALLNENLIIYNETSATAMTYTGGRSVMQFRRLFEKGCAGLHLAVEYNNLHFVVATEQIYVHDGSTVRLIAKDRVEEEFYTRAGRGGRYEGNGLIDFGSMQAVKNPDRKEITVLFDGTITDTVPSVINGTNIGWVDTNFNVVYTPNRAINGYLSTWNFGNNAILGANESGTALYSGEGLFDPTPTQDQHYSDFAYTADAGDTWATYDSGVTFGQAWVGIDSGWIHSAVYAENVGRWYVCSEGRAIYYSDDDGASWGVVWKKTTAGALHVQETISGLGVTPDGVVFGAGKTFNGGNPRTTYFEWPYKVSGYVEGDQLNRQTENSAAIGYGGIEYGGRKFIAVGGDVFMEASPVSHTFHGTFPATSQWATLGDGIILAAEHDNVTTGTVTYRVANVTDPTVTFVDRTLQTSFADKLPESVNIFAASDHYLMVVCERTNGSSSTTNMAAFLSVDGVNWSDEVVITLPDNPYVGGGNFIGAPIHAAYAGNGYWLISFMQQSNEYYVVGRIRVASTGSYTRNGRLGLVWNFEDDNYTWMDAAVDKDGGLVDVSMMHYAFDPGWGVRWSDAEVDGAKWDNSAGSTLITATTTWADLQFAGSEKNFYWLAADGVYRSDQYVKTDGVKEYFVYRDDIDLDDVVQAWTSHNYKHIKQLFFHLESWGAEPGQPNNFVLTVGAKNNLEDDPSWRPDITLNLNDTALQGKHKADFRITGRYLSMKMSFNATSKIKMSGADVDAEEAHGR